MATERAAPRISWHVPEDGGTPRDPSRIVRIGPREFRVLASVEEGRSPLTHAVSRIDLLCRNDGDEGEQVTVHLDLSGGGTRTNFDESGFGGMPRRDFVYVQHLQPPGQPWQRVDGTTDGWVASVTFAVPPGETRLGLSPWYTYADYLAFVRALPAHPCLQRRMIGLSDGGREHWELIITDPAAPAAQSLALGGAPPGEDRAAASAPPVSRMALSGQKQRVFWHTREHAYETFSSFAMEGLIDFLLSPAAADVRRRYEITLHPMANVDGVADGAEYRGGYDYPDPHGTASVRLAWETIGRLRPDLVVAWHNWHAPRDVDSLFYTDADAEGRPSRRAWDLFTQRFPSPRRLGHRWQTETEPLERNWAFRPTSQAAANANVHRHALKHLHSRVWGWEMPWWGRDDTDGADPPRHARLAGAEFARALFATLEALETPGAPPAGADQRRRTNDESTTVLRRSSFVARGRDLTDNAEVPRWGMHEIALAGRAHVENPFRDASLVGEFTSPSGRLVMVEGFYDPDDSPDTTGGRERWQLRFAPDEEGEWRYRLRGEAVELYREGRLRCVAPARPQPAVPARPQRTGPDGLGAHGPIRIHAQNPYAFAHADGTPFFGMGDTCYGLVNGIGDTQRWEYLDTRAAQRFNFVRFFACGYPWQRHPTLEGSDWWPWGGTPDEPDYDRLNPRFFRRLEGILEELHERGLRAEVLVFNLYLLSRNHGGHNPWSTAARERLWVRNLVARLAALPAVFLWTVANEFECYPDGLYRYDPSDALWVRRMGALLHACDPYGHPTTVHPMGIAGGGLVRAQGPLFGEGSEIDVLTHQQNSYDTATRVDTPAPGYWEGSGAGVDTALRLDRVHRKPVINTEFGYEWLAGYPTNYQGQTHSTDKCRRTAWRIFVSGGAALAAGFSGTWHGRDASFRSAPAPFVVADQGAARQLGFLYDFITTLPLGRLEPFDGITAGPGAPGAPGGEADPGTPNGPNGSGGVGEALALADPGKTYLVYLPHGGDAWLDLSDAFGNLNARWFNPRTGESGLPFSVPGGRLWHLTAPDSKDWAVRVDAEA